MVDLIKNGLFVFFLIIFGKFLQNNFFIFKLYSSLQGMVKYCNRAWKQCFFFFCLFFRNISKTAEIILIKKIWRNHDISVNKKALISEHRKNYIFRDNCFVKMSVSLYVTKFLWTSLLKNQCEYQNFTHGFGAMRADQILIHIGPKLREERELKFKIIIFSN